jgi:serine-type D-Ala-D-Ala carboxypeptidase
MKRGHKMPFDFSAIEKILQEALPKATPAAQLTIRLSGRSVFSHAYGHLDPDTRSRATQRSSLFDVASLTKLFTATTFMRLVEEGRAGLDQPVSQVLPEFTGMRPILPYEDPVHWGSWVDVTGEANQPGRDIRTVDAGVITFRQLLRHTSGLPAWRPLKDQPDTAAAQRMALETFFSYPPDTYMLYSDIGIILLGMAVEKLAGCKLPLAVEDRVTGPLGLSLTRFLPLGNTVPLLVAPTELCQWRGRRIIGEVHDENAHRLGGVAGHAGIFSTADEIARFGQIFLPHDDRPMTTGPLTYPLRQETIAEMTRQQSEADGERRGLGFALWNSDARSSSNPFSPRAFGHTGFTGTSLWIDPERDLVVALLTNEVYNGRENRLIAPLRVAVHRIIVQAVDAALSAASQQPSAETGAAS